MDWRSFAVDLKSGFLDADSNGAHGVTRPTIDCRFNDSMREILFCRALSSNFTVLRRPLHFERAVIPFTLVG